MRPRWGRGVERGSRRAVCSEPFASDNTALAPQPGNETHRSGFLSPRCSSINTQTHTMHTHTRAHTHTHTHNTHNTHTHTHTHTHTLLCCQGKCLQILPPSILPL